MRALALLLALPFVLAPMPATAQAVHPVAVVDFAFAPGLVTVDPGDTVQWRNQGSAAHTVTADDGSWGSGVLGPGATYSLVPASPGVVAYHCAIHASMHGTILVRDPTLPDLAVAALAVLPGDLPTEKTIQYAVSNDGGAPAGPSVLRLTYSDARGEHPLAEVQAPALAPGDRFEGSLAWDGTGDVGDLTLHALADAGGAVAEGPAEGNNAASATATFLASTGGTGIAVLPLLGS